MHISSILFPPCEPPGSTYPPSACGAGTFYASVMYSQEEMGRTRRVSWNGIEVERTRDSLWRCWKATLSWEKLADRRTVWSVSVVRIAPVGYLEDRTSKMSNSVSFLSSGLCFLNYGAILRGCITWITACWVIYLEITLFNLIYLCIFHLINFFFNFCACLQWVSYKQSLARNSGALDLCRACSSEKPL